MILKRWKTISKKKMEDYLKKNYLKMEDDLTKKMKDNLNLFIFQMEDYLKKNERKPTK